MRDKLKKTLLTTLPLAGILLWGGSSALAHDDGRHHSRRHENWRHERFHNRLGDVHERKHDQLGALHGEFHEHPYSRKEHRRFHRWLKRDHRDFHNDRYDTYHNYHNRDRYWDRRYDGRWDQDNWYAGRRDYGNGWRYGSQGNYWGWGR